MSARTKVIIGLVIGAAVVVMLTVVLAAAGGFLYYRLQSRVQMEHAMRAEKEAELARHAAMVLAAEERAKDESFRLVAAAGAAETPAPIAAPAAVTADARPLAERRKEAMARGAEFLLKQQAEDGSWGKGNVGITALVTDALVAAGKTVKDPPVRKAVDYLLKAQKDDGGIYDDVGLKTYSTRTTPRPAPPPLRRPRTGSSRTSGTRARASTARTPGTAATATANTSGRTCRTHSISSRRCTGRTCPRTIRCGPKSWCS
jgi:hypothetical protein